MHRLSRIGDVWAPELVVKTADALPEGDKLFGEAFWSTRSWRLGGGSHEVVDRRGTRDGVVAHV